MYRWLRPLLFQLEAERAHDRTLDALDLMHGCGLDRAFFRPAPSLPTRAFGLEFPNPVGLAAGLDKNGAHIDALATLGFGFIEVGTVTPRAQAGNPRPRLFRLPQQQAIINRMGFNNAGVDALVRNLQRRRFSGVLGVNIGKNSDTPNERALEDFRHCLERVYALASYVTVNLSSPNTPGLRDLQHRENLRALVSGLRETQERLSSRHGRHTPMLLKIAPDLDEQAMDEIAEVLLMTGVDGLICTNTTVERPGLEDTRHANEAGGLSGAPLMARATAVLRGMADRLQSHIPLIGVGGISRGADAADKILAGASLVQCYSGLVFRGPALVGECVQAIRTTREARDAG